MSRQALFHSYNITCENLGLKVRSPALLSERLDWKLTCLVACLRLSTLPASARLSGLRSSGSRHGDLASEATQSTTVSVWWV